MKLSGYFRSVKRANVAVEELKKAGFKANLDLNDDVENFGNSLYTNGLAAAPANSSIVLRSGNFSRDDDVSPLAAANPMVSGMGGFEEIADVNAKVSAEGDEEKIKKIIESLGGALEGPEVDLMSSIED